MSEILDQDIDWIEPFRAREIHFVCVAIGGLTTCDLAAVTIGGMGRHEDVWPMTKQLNEEGKTGTIHPRLPLTIVPLLSWGERKCPEDVEGYLRKCFHDVAATHRSHIRLKTMVIDLNGWGSDYPFTLARKVAGEVLSGEESLEKVIFLPDCTPKKTYQGGHWMKF